MYVLIQMVEVSVAVGVRTVSVYGFALGNFYRVPEEVTGLLALAETLFCETQWIE